MKDVPAMGQKRDRHNRIRLARNDDEARRKKISEARGLIYEKMYAVTADAVVARLADKSMVPSDVSPSTRLVLTGLWWHG